MATVSNKSIEIISNAENVIKAKNEAIRRGLRMVGLQAEGYAKMACPYDTGLLRNSITYAVGGELTHIASYAANNGENPGRYEGAAPADSEKEATLYVGTNVEYAPYVELGHHQQPGRYVPAIGKRLVASYVPGKPFLRPAVEDHLYEYHSILIGEMNK